MDTQRKLEIQEKISSDLFARIDAFKAEYQALAGVAEARITVPNGEEDSSLVPDLWIEILIRRHLP